MKHILPKYFRSVFFNGALLFVMLFYFGSCLNSNSTSLPSSSSVDVLNKENIKQKGAHVFGRIDSTNLGFVSQCNFDWVTLVPFGDQRNHDSPSVRHFRRDSLHLRSRDSSWVNRIRLAHNAGFKVFMKPHLWLHATEDGKWRSDVFPKNEEDWETWKVSYRDFILRYAIIAEKTNAEMFCIGAELTRLTLEKPAYWRTLIKEVKAIYSGKITYAANWYEEYEKITFWDELDFIGIQAYFPLVKNEYPTVNEISKGWSKHLPSLKLVHEKFKRKILFTELGYKSTPDSAIEPWGWIDYMSKEETPVAYETQANCYQAFFDEVWNKDWFAGVHIWQVRTDFEKGRGKSNLDFTPQGKPAETTIMENFK